MAKRTEPVAAYADKPAPPAGARARPADRSPSQTGSNLPSAPPLLSNERDVDWLPKPNRVEFLLDASAPAQPVVGAYLFGFLGEDLLVVQHPERGWDLPGVDGALPASGVAEALAAGQAAGLELGRAQLLGHFRLSMPGPDSQGAIVLVVAPVTALAEFAPSALARQRRTVAPGEVDTIEFLRQYRVVYDAARAQALSLAPG